jgi:hypothetical protein
LRAYLEALAERSRRSLSDVAQLLLDEAIRLRECPGIYFADEPTGRTAKVTGTGLGVGEIMRDYLAAGEPEDRLREIFAPDELQHAQRQPIGAGEGSARTLRRSVRCTPIVSNDILLRDPRTHMGDLSAASAPMPTPRSSRFRDDLMSWSQPSNSTWRRRWPWRSL